MTHRLPSNIRTACAAAVLATLASHAQAEWTTEINHGQILGKFHEIPQATWQIGTLDRPGASPAFLPSAFLHPLHTPAGFQWTAAMPADHIHHLGLWWPWKHIELGGQQYNCWELQSGQGAHHAVSAKIIEAGPDAMAFESHNEIRIRKSDDAGPPATHGITAIHEQVTTRIARHGADANVIDLTIRHTAANDAPVTIGQYRYSGFSWRGPKAWNKDNSEMTTSGNLDRDEANGSLATWVLVTGPGNADGTTASVLMMSAAKKIAGTPERLRVWNSNSHNGTPFVNFNPVQAASLPLDADHPAVSHRQYRILAADRKLTVEDAEAEWQAWQK